MGKYLLLFVLFMFVFGCSNEDEHDLTWGYACIDSSCISAVNGPYDLEECQSMCSSDEE